MFGFTHEYAAIIRHHPGEEESEMTVEMLDLTLTALETSRIQYFVGKHGRVLLNLKF